VSGFGILCATPEELAALRARLSIDTRPQAHGPTRVWRGSHDGDPLVLAQMGIGKVMRRPRRPCCSLCSNAGR
jgi:adenosylhomocysteine nucleosidase